MADDVNMGDVYYDEKLQSLVVKQVGPWIISIAHMTYNDRILLTHESEYPMLWVSGFCYDRGLEAFAAACVWNPFVQPRPIGYKKIAAEDLARWDRYNAEWRESRGQT